MTAIGAETSMLARVRLADRIGIVPRLLIGSLLALVLAVVCVEFWTLRAVQESGLQRAEDLLGSSMAMLKHELAPLGAAWTTAADGQLVLGTTKLSGRNDLVDAVKDISAQRPRSFRGTLGSPPTSRTPTVHGVSAPSSRQVRPTMLSYEMDIATKAQRRSLASRILPSTSRSGMVRLRQSVSCLLVYL
jgi:hypothetical protein